MADTAQRVQRTYLVLTLLTTLAASFIWGINTLFLALVALTIVISLQAVGIILVVAMLVTPAATAQLLAVRFGRMMAIAVVVGIVASVAGLYLSFWLDPPTGATIVLVETAFFLIAMLLGPRTGLLARRRVATA